MLAEDEAPLFRRIVNMTLGCKTMPQAIHFNGTLGDVVNSVNGAQTLAKQAHMMLDTDMPDN